MFKLHKAQHSDGTARIGVDQRRYQNQPQETQYAKANQPEFYPQDWNPGVCKGQS